jgi:hypothetical protein
MYLGGANKLQPGRWGAGGASSGGDYVASAGWSRGLGSAVPRRGRAADRLRFALCKIVQFLRGDRLDHWSAKELRVELEDAEFEVRDFRSWSKFCGLLGFAEVADRKR